VLLPASFLLLFGHVTLVWCIYALAAAGIGIAAGVATGLVANRQWPASRRNLTAWLGACALWAVCVDIRRSTHTPYPPQLLAERGFPILAGLIGVAVIVLSALLATVVARLFARGID
jgi:hypothetical protein